MEAAAEAIADPETLVNFNAKEPIELFFSCAIFQAREEWMTELPPEMQLQGGIKSALYSLVLLMFYLSIFACF
jgi:hypothetical protein